MPRVAPNYTSDQSDEIDFDDPTPTSVYDRNRLFSMPQEEQLIGPNYNQEAELNESQANIEKDKLAEKNALETEFKKHKEQKTQKPPKAPINQEIQLIEIPPFKVTLSVSPVYIEFEASTEYFEKKMIRLFNYIRIAGKLKIQRSNRSYDSSDISLKSSKIPTSMKDLADYSLKIRNVFGGEWDKSLETYTNHEEFFWMFDINSQSPRPDVEFKFLKGFILLSFGGKLNPKMLNDVLAPVLQERSQQDLNDWKIVEDSTALELWITVPLDIAGIKKLGDMTYKYGNELAAAQDKLKSLMEQVRANKAVAVEKITAARNEVELATKKVNDVKTALSNTKGNFLNNPLKSLLDKILSKNPIGGITSYEKLLNTKVFIKTITGMQNVLARTRSFVMPLIKKVFPIVLKRVRNIILAGAIALLAAPTGVGIAVSVAEALIIIAEVGLLIYDIYTLLPDIARFCLAASKVFVNLLEVFIEIAGKPADIFIDYIIKAKNDELKTLRITTDEKKLNFEGTNAKRENDLKSENNRYENERNDLVSQQDAERERLNQADIFEDAQSQNISERDKQLNSIEGQIAEKDEKINNNNKELNSIKEGRNNLEAAVKESEESLKQLEAYKDRNKQSYAKIFAGLDKFKKIIDDAENAVSEYVASQDEIPITESAPTNTLLDEEPESELPEAAPEVETEPASASPATDGLEPVPESTFDRMSPGG